MNKGQFVELLVETGAYETKKDAQKAVDTVLSVIEQQLIKGEPVEFVGFGKFYTEVQKGREGKIPGTDRTYKTEDKRVPKFKPGKKLKDKVAQIQGV